MIIVGFNQYILAKKKNGTISDSLGVLLKCLQKMSKLVKLS